MRRLRLIGSDVSACASVSILPRAHRLERPRLATCPSRSRSTYEPKHAPFFVLFCRPGRYSRKVIQSAHVVTVVVCFFLQANASLQFFDDESKNNQGTVSSSLKRPTYARRPPNTRTSLTTATDVLLRAFLVTAIPGYCISFFVFVPFVSPNSGK